MHLERLFADGFRNLSGVEIYPDPRFNVLTGDNGQGKTNTLETIWLLAGLRSFRTRRLAETIAFDRDHAELGARIRHHGASTDVGLRIGGGRNIVFIDGKKQDRGRDYLGNLVAVLFTPDDLRLPFAEPAHRRRYLDRAIWTHDRDFLKAMRTYEKALANRNALLRDHVGRSIDAGMLDVFDDLLSRSGATVGVHRETFVNDFMIRVQEEFSAFAPDSLRCSLRYHAKVGGGCLDVDERAELITAELGARRDTDRRRGFTSVGPHHDDLILELNGRPARVHASQGQCRAMVLAMKIAELRSLERTHGEPPILLMDDVSSELDKTRNAALMAHLDALGGQVFLTTTDAAHILVTAPTAIFNVVSGTIARRTAPGGSEPASSTGSQGA